MAKMTMAQAARRGHVARSLRQWCGANRAQRTSEKSLLTHFESRSNSENTITPLFSSTHPEQFFRPFVFNNSSGATFIFNIFLC
jgi:hypothetical protein